MPITPSRLPAPAVSWLVDSSPFSVQVGVGPDSAHDVLGALFLLALCRLVFAFRLRYKVVELSLPRRIVIVATFGGLSRHQVRQVESRDQRAAATRRRD